MNDLFKLHLLHFVTLLVLNLLNQCSGNSDLFFSQRQPEPRKEVFVFSTKSTNYKLYDWSKITTFAQCRYHDPELLKFAHSKNVTVVYKTAFDPSILYSQPDIEKWIEQQVDYAIEKGLDGINVDYEQDMNCTDTRAIQGYNYLMQRLVKRFKAVINNAQVSIDIPYAPGDWSGRCYDYQTLGKAVDFSFVMMYDEPRPYQHTAWANSGFNASIYGLTKYKELGIPVSKLLLGVPWYGYEYACLKYDVQQNRCWLSNPSGRASHGYSAIRHLMKDLGIHEPMWDNAAKSPYFSWKAGGDAKMHQLWFDNPLSLAYKYLLAEQMGLRGVGMWEADSLDYSNNKEMREYMREMWDTLP